jgi:hypothetical protein
MKFQQQKGWSSIKWWIVVNVVALPFAGFAIFVIAGFTSWGASFNGFDIKLWAQFLPVVFVAGGVCGIALGLLQGYVLRRERIKVSSWLMTTSLGMAFDAVLAYTGWQLFSLTQSNTLPIRMNLLVFTVFGILAVFHGCSLAGAQWMTLRRSGWLHSFVWIWLAGISWSILTPFPLAFLIETIQANKLPIDPPLGTETVIFILFPLLLSLPYIVATTYLLERHSVRQHAAESAV